MNNTITPEQQLASWRRHFETRLQAQLPSAQSPPQRLHAAMEYASLAGGKRLRPLLSYATAELLGLPVEQLDASACAIELMHCYSLIHDDLPAMDDDDLRRGHPTCHRQFDEATAILAGDALQSLAFAVLAADAHPGTTAASRVQMLALLAQASGSSGMAGGQALDLAAQGHSLSQAELEQLHNLKTGALIRASVLLPCLAAPAPADTQQALAHYAGCIGLAFQVRDDVLDIIGTTEALGKKQGQDSHHHKATFPALMGVNAAQDFASNLHQQALAALQPFGQRADCLRLLADQIITRSH